MFHDATRGDPPPGWNRYLAVLEGAALGDAFGWALEQADAQVWLARDPSGDVLRRLVPVGGREGLAGDCTQQLLFVAEGLLRAHNASTAARAPVDPVGPVHAALLRWLGTQRGVGPPPRPDGWLVGRPALHARRARGAATQQALRTGLCGRRDRPVNNLADAAGVLRGIPAGLVRGWAPFELAQDLAAITHGNPRVHLAAGAVAVLVSALIGGATWEGALDTTWAHLEEAGTAARPLLAALDLALEQADLGEPGPARLAAFGDGRDPESAVAIALYSVAVSPAADAMGLAVMHAGAADRTGALAGALAGARHGRAAVPEDAVNGLELAVEVRQLASDLFHHFGHGPFFEPSEEDWARYPA
jgi:ADP-ribosylglycohydrolase